MNSVRLPVVRVGLANFGVIDKNHAVFLAGHRNGGAEFGNLIPLRAKLKRGIARRQDGADDDDRVGQLLPQVSNVIQQIGDILLFWYSKCRC